MCISKYSYPHFCCQKSFPGINLIFNSAISSLTPFFNWPMHYGLSHLITSALNCFIHLSLNILFGHLQIQYVIHRSHFKTHSYFCFTLIFFPKQFHCNAISDKHTATPKSDQTINIPVASAKGCHRPPSDCPPGIVSHHRNSEKSVKLAPFQCNLDVWAIKMGSL